MQISKMQEKIDKKLFVFKIISSELVAIKLTNSYKALRLTKTDFFRLSYLPNDQ